MKWELEEGGTLGQGGEYTPTQFPRNNEERDALSTWNKGGASQNERPSEAVVTNSDGNTNVPRHADGPIDYYDQGDGKDIYTVGAEDVDGGKDMDM